MTKLGDILELYKGTDEQGEFHVEDCSSGLCDRDWDCDCHGGDCYGDCR